MLRKTSLTISRTSTVHLRCPGQLNKRCRKPVVMQATGKPTDPADSTSVSSDFQFIAKLVGISFAGAAAVKYGSLLSPVPFDANPLLAALLVVGPPTAYAVILLLSSNEEEAL